MVIAKALTSIDGEDWKRDYEQGGLETLRAYASSVWRNGSQFQFYIVRSLEKAIQISWPNINDLKAMNIKQ